MKFAEHVKKETNGDFEIEIFPSMQLGNDKEMYQMLKMGTLDLLDGTNNTPGYTEEGKNFNATGAPYCFRDESEWAKFIKTPTFDYMQKQLQTKGVKWLGYSGTRSPRALTTTKVPVKTPADMKGLKLRVPGLKSLIAFFEACGANPTAMPLSELFMALKTGVVDGQDNGILTVNPQGFYEVQKYYMNLNHAQGAHMIYTGIRKWNKYPEKLQKALLEACQIAADHHNKLKVKATAEAYENVKKHGMVVMDVDQAAFEKIAHTIWPKFDGVNWEKGFMDRVQKELQGIR